MKLAGILLLLLVFCSQAAQAQECYTPYQFEAEQGLRIHSELMVIALTCMKVPGYGPQMYNKYVEFTRKNQNLIASYENAMLDYYKTEENLNNLKTKLANKISRDAISMSVTSFCHTYGARIDQALAMDQGTLRRWAEQVWPQAPTTQPLCRR